MPLPGTTDSGQQMWQRLELFITDRAGRWMQRCISRSICARARPKGNRMNITIRELREEDVKKLAEIEAESFSMPWSEKDFRDLLSHPYCMYVVALLDGEPVGCSGFTNICDVANIDNVVVAPAFRGLGVAQAMLRELISRGEAEHVEAFTLEVRVSNEAAIHVYEKFGFVSEGIRPRFYERPVEDANIMWRRNEAVENIK